MTEPTPLQQVDRTFVRFNNRKLSFFGGCDYFRLASHPKVLHALRRGAEKYGLNVAASRLTTGNHVLFYELEKSLSEFFGAETATLVSGGYVTNMVVAQALSGSFSHALVDAKAHPSLCDAARFLECPIIRFRHRDVEHMADTVKRLGPGARPILLTDGMFSNDGSVAPLKAYLKLLPRDGLILVDDAHGGAVLGATGKGSLEYAGVERRRVIQTTTLSKAFGAYGGVALGPPWLRKKILDRSTFFIASTPLPLPLANASLESVRILKSDPSYKQRLEQNSDFVKRALTGIGFPLPDAPGPIIPVIPERKKDVGDLQKCLLKAGIFPSFIRYPNGPNKGYFRFVLSSEHSQSQLKSLVQALSHCYISGSGSSRPR